MLTKLEEGTEGKSEAITKHNRILDGSDEQLQFEKLRKIRLELATASNVPAYVILSDRSLKDLCIHQPKTLDLKSVHGFGDVKIGKFGQEFIDALNEG